MMRIFTSSSDKFRAIGVDTFSNDEWISGEFETLEEAIKHAEKQAEGKCMLKMHVYNAQGEHLFDSGTF